MIIMAFNTNKITSIFLEDEIANTVLKFQHEYPFVICSKLTKEQAEEVEKKLGDRFNPVLYSAEELWTPNHEYRASDPAWMDAEERIRQTLLPAIESGKLPFIYDGDQEKCMSTILAASINAHEVWYWSDSDGIYTQDSETKELFAYVTMKEAHTLTNTPIDTTMLLPIKDKGTRFRFRNPSHPEQVGTIIL